MWDLSEYMKSLKQCFTRWYNAMHDCSGTLWEERFKSVLVEDGHAARVMAAYIDLNAVRAGIVEDPKDYRWSGYGEAVAGEGVAREGLCLVMFEQLSCQKGKRQAAGELASWREVVRVYRMVLFESGEEGTEHGSGPDEPAEGWMIEHGSSYEGQTADALASEGDEGRGKLR